MPQYTKATRAATLAALMVAGSALLAQADTVRVVVAEYSSKTGPYFQEAAQAFETANPGHSIQIEVVPWDVLLQKLTTDISAGTNADLSIIGTRWLLDFVDEGIAAPLDSYMDGAFRNRFFEAFLSPSVMQGQTWGLPIAASARAMYYNKTLLDQAGVAVPNTWEELRDAAIKVSALGEDIAGFGMQGKEIETDVYFYYAFWAFGGNMLDADGTSGLDSAAGYQAAALYKGLIDAGATQPGVTSYNREDVQNLFKQGKVGMMITAPFLSAQISEEAPDLNYGVALIPAGPGGQRGTYGVTDSIVMFENSAVKESAWAFLDMLFSSEWRERFTAGEGFLPVNAEVAALPVFTENADLKEFAAMLPQARFAPVVSGWEEIAARTSDALQRIYLGQGEIKDELDRAASEINGILAR